MPEWFEDESLWIDLFPFTFSDERLGLGEAEVARILALVDLGGPRGQLLQAGFATVSLHGDLDGRPYGLDAPRLVAVARAGP